MPGRSPTSLGKDHVGMQQVTSAPYHAVIASSSEKKNDSCIHIYIFKLAATVSWQLTSANVTLRCCKNALSPLLHSAHALGLGLLVFHKEHLIWPVQFQLGFWTM